MVFFHRRVIIAHLRLGVSLRNLADGQRVCVTHVMFCSDVVTVNYSGTLCWFVTVMSDVVLLCGV